MDVKFLADQKDAIPVIAEWYFKQWGILAGEKSVDETILKLQEYLNRKKIPLLILAAEKREIMGVVQLKRYEMDIYPDKEHWLGGVYVAPEFRGKRVASRLVTRAAGIAHSFGIDTLYLQTERLDGGLYAHLGWEPLEQVEYRGLNVLVMERALGTDR